MPIADFPVATYTFTSAINSITFSSISQSYRDLVIIINAGNSAITGFVGVFNNDNASNYVTTYTGANGATSGSGFTNSSNANFAPASWANAPISSDYTINLMEYSQTDKQKYFLSRVNGQPSGSYTSMNNGRWNSTSAINSIKIMGLTSSNFSIGSTISIYGVVA